jgi:hypothetical protein
MKAVSLARSVLTAILLATTLLPAPALLADGLKIRIPVPPVPKIVLPAPPPMIWLPSLQVYVAHDTPHNIFFHDGHYYLFHQSAWYLGPGYAGPWTAVKVREVPPGLRNFHGERWDEYEHEADRRYRGWHDDDDHHPFYARRDAHERHERAYWHAQEDHDRGNRDEHRDRRNHDQDRGKHRGRGRDDD